MAQLRRAYPFHLIEPKWQRFWDEQETFRAFNPGQTVPADHPFGQRHGLAGRQVRAEDLPPKFYILDMFPYPSGAGLHVGHPEGYTATDVLARYRRACGWHVLHPMGWDAFGLPAEQYAVKTGQHPRQATEANIATFKRQIKSLGFSYDWRREVDTTDPGYFKWTQWIFLQLYNSYFDPHLQQARPIALLEDALSHAPQHRAELEGNGFLRQMHQAWLQVPPEQRPEFRRQTLDRHRLAYVAEMPVWWCEELGTVLANEEVIDGRSEVGGYPVVRRPMRQWMLRITAYAERLLKELDWVDWPESIKEMQRNWIGRSEGAQVEFPVEGSDERILVFTTRPDTLFGATYMVLAPEHRLVDQLTTPAQRAAVQAYRAAVAQKSDLERTDLAREKTGVFLGAYAINPVNHQRIPIWIADYVLISYGTGAIMAVPAHDTRDLEFADKFNLPVVQVVQPPDPQTDWRGFVGDGVSVNSTGPEVSITGLPTPEAKRKIVAWLESKGLGRRAVNYKLRDWLFSRQRYWGEPFPIVWRPDAQGRLQHEPLPESALPVLLPDLQDYRPTPDGQPPLARARHWGLLPDGAVRETNTMPQWAGSCWYYLRYLDPNNDQCFCGSDAERYWMSGGLNAQTQAGQNSPSVAAAEAEPGPRPRGLRRQPVPGVDLYVGGTEHAVLHLLYARFWHKVLYDLGYVSTPEPFFKLVNQGLILGEDGQKMSKSRGNVINPDDILQAYGADAFRMYEMFMGPLEMVKPWSTQGVEGVYRFLGRVWRLFVDEQSETELEQAATTAATPGPQLLDHIRLSAAIQAVPASPAQLKALHACIKKVTEDLEGLRFNTAISALMIFVNEATTWPVKPASVLRAFLQLLAPFAPHLAEELWVRLHQHLGQKAPSLTYEPWPPFDPALLAEATLEIVVQVNGKVRGVVQVPAEASTHELEAAALNCPKAKPFWAGKPIRRVVVVPRKLVNIVTG